MTDKKHIHLIDTTLRDGSHAISHKYNMEQIKEIAFGLDSSGIEYIEVSHGDGLAASSINYGFASLSDEEMLRAAASVIKNGKLTVLSIPGIGTVEDLKLAADCGAKACRIATHVTEADIARQHIGIAKELGMEVCGFLMMIANVEPEKIAEQAKLFESYGVDFIAMADSSGALLPGGVKSRVSAVVKAVGIPVDFHAHNSLSLAMGNCLAAVESGAAYLDCSLRGLGAGAGNAQSEVLVGVLDKAGYETGIDFLKIMDVAENIVEPVMQRPQVIRNTSLMLGYAGVYSSFLLFTYRAAEKFKLDPRDILVELGRRRMVGGQEDMIIDVAYQLSKENNKSKIN
jgi:4-hydroxy-2-oxovalerate aldolase